MNKKGLCGWGEIAPLPGFSSESLGEAESQLKQVIKIMQSIHLESISGIMDQLSHAVDLLPSVRCGVELALWNLRNRIEETPYRGIVGEELNAKVYINALISTASPSFLQEVEGLRYLGYKAVKLKVGNHPVVEEIQHTRILREKVGDQLIIRVDANEKWELSEAVTYASGLKDYKIDYIEDPLSDAAMLSSFYEQTGISYAIDQCLSTPSELLSINLKGCKAIVLKPSLLGGYLLCKEWERWACNRGILPVYSSLFESGVGILGLACMGAGLKSPNSFVGLDTYRYLSQDVWKHRLEVSKGALDLSIGIYQNQAMNMKMLEEIR